MYKTVFNSTTYNDSLFILSMKFFEQVSSGLVDVKPLITHRFKLEEVVKAFEVAKSGEGIKVIIKCRKE